MRSSISFQYEAFWTVATFEWFVTGVPNNHFLVNVDSVELPLFLRFSRVISMD